MDRSSLWEKCIPPLIPRRTLNGKWTFDPGQTWRRKHERKWEYMKADETFEELAEKQW